VAVRFQEFKISSLISRLISSFQVFQVFDFKNSGFQDLLRTSVTARQYRNRGPRRTQVAILAKPNSVRKLVFVLQSPIAHVTGVDGPVSNQVAVRFQEFKRSSLISNFISRFQVWISRFQDFKISRFQDLKMRA